MTLRRAGTAVGLAGVAAFAVLLPQTLSTFRTFQFAYVGIYFIAVLGLNVLTGYSGQISLGHGAFMALGAYTTAILEVHDVMRDLWTIPLAGLVAGAVGFLFGFPALRLHGAYLALATFAIPVALIALAKRFQDFTGGGGGLSLRQPKPQFGLHTSPSHWLYYLIWSIASVLLVAAWLLLRGRVGRAFRAVRESETAAVSAGVNLAVYKTLAFGISAFYAGVAGSLLAITVAYVNPDTFPITLSILLLTGIVIGGLGSLSGVVVGALFIEFVPTFFAQQISKQAPSAVYGIILLLVLFVMPTGAVGLVKTLFGVLTNSLHNRPISEIGPDIDSSKRRRA